MAFSVSAKDLTLTDCPPVVQDAIKKNSRDGKLDDVKTHTMDGRTTYVAEIDLSKDRDLKLFISSEGVLQKYRESATLSDVPAVVRDVIKNLTPAGAKVDDIDKEVADGKTVYDVEIDREKDPDIKVIIAEDGTILSQK